MSRMSTRALLRRRPRWSRLLARRRRVSYYAIRHPDGLELRRRADRASSTPPKDSAQRRQPAGRLRARRASTTPGSPAASPGWSAWSCMLLLGGGLFWPCAGADSRPRRARRTRPPGGRLSVGAGHGHHLHFHGHPRCTALPAHLKLARPAWASCCVVVATPARGVLGLRRLRRRCSAAVVARVPGAVRATSRKRMVVEVPFVVFALLMPFIAHRARGSRCWAAALSRARPARPPGALLAKGTLGVLASLILAATTEPGDLLARAASGCGCPTCSCRSWAS